MTEPGTATPRQAPSPPPPAQQRRPFAFARWAVPLLWPLGVRPDTAWVDVDATTDAAARDGANAPVGPDAETAGAGVLRVRYGRWRIDMPMSNVACVEVTGPYRPWKIIGPHLSLADDGLTLGTTTARGLCVRFAEPIEPVLPLIRRRHSALTITVADPEVLAERLSN